MNIRQRPSLKEKEKKKNQKKIFRDLRTLLRS